MAILVHLYEPDGVTLVGQLLDVWGMTWQDELSKPGSGSFNIAATDALFAQITPRRIVKFTWNGSVRFAFRILADSIQSAVEHLNGRVAQVSGPGLLALLHDAVVLPEYGLGRIAGDDRRFGFMSRQGAWYVSAEWVAPGSTTIWTAYAHAPQYPLKWPDATAYWVAPSPTSDVGLKAWFRGEFTVSTAYTAVRIAVSADDEFEAYLDGEFVSGAKSDAAVPTETQFGDDVPLAVGDHVLAIQTTDAFQWTGESLRGEIIAAVYTLNSEGQPDTIIFHSSPTSFLVRPGTAANGEPGWRRAQVIKKCFDEAQARGAAGLQNLTLGFTDTLDSNGSAWTDRGDYNLPNAMIHLDEVVQRFTEDLIDASVDPVTMTLHLWLRKGADLSGTVALTLGVLAPTTGTLVQYTTARNSNLINDVYGRLKDGTWVHRTDATSVSDWGNVEAGAAIGSTTSNKTAEVFLDGVLAQTADVTTSIEATPAALAGAVAYTDYTVGDSITVPGHGGVGTMKARVLAITVTQDGENVTAVPELAEDLT